MTGLTLADLQSDVWEHSPDVAGEFPRHAAIYLRVSTIDQHTSNQEAELRQASKRAGWEVVKVYRDQSISGAKGQDKRPAFDALCCDASRRPIDVEQRILAALKAGKSIRRRLKNATSIRARCSGSSALSTAQASPREAAITVG